jgi:hypothetical protein
MKNTNHKKRRWKKLLIHPKFQLSVIIYSTSLSILLSFVQYLALKNFFGKYYREGINIGLAKQHPFFKFLEDQETYMNKVYLVTSLLVLVITVMAGLILSHRVAGPLHRLKTYLLKAGSAEEPANKLSFRHGDFFQDIPPVVNETIDRLKQE